MYCIKLFTYLYISLFANIFYSNLDFQAYIVTSSEAIAEIKIWKLTFSTALRLSTKAVDPYCLKTFNIVIIDKKYWEEIPFFSSLLRVIINIFDVVITNSYNNFNQKLSKLDNNQTFLLLEIKKSIHCNKFIIKVIILYMFCYTHNKRFNLLQIANNQLLFTHNMLK